ncbi:MAG: GAF domain-containing protein [Acidobacteria bacterium]|nr:GAF domain-containing protein [Acidobacteriota bacterium]
MKKDSTLGKVGEILAFSLVLGAVNYFFPANPGFLEGFFNPYLVLPLFVAVYHGKYYAFLSLVLSAVVVAVGLPAAAGLITRGTMKLPFGLWQRLWEIAPLPVAAALVEVYLLGLVRDSLVRRDAAGRGKLAAFSRDKGLLKRQVRALQSANRELEERISRQEDSITSLYSQVQVLNSLNLSKALQAMLEMVRRFIGATRCSIWEHRPEARRLELVARLGEEPADGQLGAIAMDGSIEGWVVRNNSMFSVKMVLENQQLAKLDTGRAIIALPIAAGRRIWGVLSVEEMPFAKYNLYAERLLLLIMTLAGPALERAIEYEAVVRQEDINPVTGLPSFSQFYALLERELSRQDAENGTLAVMVMELLNFPALVAEHGREPTLRLLAEITPLVLELSGGKARFFHYKGETQLAVLAPNLDADGASLFSLNLLTRVNEHQWALRDTRVFLELILGFGVRAGAGQSADDLLEAAENLLEMQKV